MAGTLTVQNIEGPSSGSDANKIIIPSGQTLYAPGHVVQVVQGSLLTQITTTSTSMTATGLSASITPTSVSSKILISVSIPARSTGDVWGTTYRIYKNGVSHQKIMSGFGYTDPGTDDFSGIVACTYLDSPATTSSTTYEIYYGAQGGSSTQRMSVDNDDSFITLMEIAG